MGRVAAGKAREHAGWKPHGSRDAFLDFLEAFVVRRRMDLRLQFNGLFADHRSRRIQAIDSYVRQRTASR